MTNLSRRSAVGLGLAATALPRFARAQNPKEVKIAMLAPLSGPWARSGLLMQMGARMAVDEVNANGGIQALGLLELPARLGLEQLTRGGVAVQLPQVARQKQYKSTRRTVPRALYHARATLSTHH